MFKITKNKSISTLNVSVQIDADGIFDLVPLHPKELTVNYNQLVLHTPGFQTLTVNNPSGLYVVFQNTQDTLKVQHFN